MSTNIASIAEVITREQIGRAADRFSERCRVNASLLPKDTVQMVLEEEGKALAEEMFEVLRVRVERRTKTIVRRVKVNRTRTPQQALDATRRKQYTDSAVVESMPRGEGDEVRVMFFKPEEWEYTRPGFMSDDDLEKCFNRRNFKPADPYSVVAVNEADRAFADENPHGTHWKNACGEWGFASFIRGVDERVVGVSRGGNGWSDDCLFPGLPK